jgi:hypothetical protein
MLDVCNVPLRVAAIVVGEVDVDAGRQITVINGWNELDAVHLGGDLEVIPQIIDPASKGGASFDLVQLVNNYFGLQVGVSRAAVVRVESDGTLRVKNKIRVSHHHSPIIVHCVKPSIVLLSVHVACIDPPDCLR